VERQICATPADIDAARGALSTLLDKTSEAAESLGHIDYNYYVSRLGEQLAADGQTDQAQSVLETLIGALSERKVAPRVIEELRLTRESIGQAGATAKGMRPVAIDQTVKGSAKA
jgi:hypothetical protein